MAIRSSRSGTRRIWRRCSRRWRIARSYATSSRRTTGFSRRKVTSIPPRDEPGAATGRPFLVAHRGAPRERPENTLPSFLRALELGAEGIELDVHGTCDGVVVVHHDPVPRAIAPSGRLAGRRIDALTFDELQGFSVRGVALIPTLAEALAVVR